MNSEIKEILDRLDYNEWEVALYKVPITWCELYDIRDYITNLQQENEYLKKNNPEQNIEHFRIIKENKRKINNLREENKTLHENNQNMQEEMARVWEENERLKELCNKYEKEHNTTFKEWQKDIQANKKAIEYIKENQEEEYVTGKPMLSYWAIDNLLNILQNGSDDNE